MIRLLETTDIEDYRSLLRQTVNEAAFSMSLATINGMTSCEVEQQLLTSEKHLCVGLFLRQ